MSQTVTGWVESRRVLGKIAFIMVRDDTDARQLLVAEPHLIEAVCTIRPQSLVRFRVRPRSHASDDELEVDGFDVVAGAPPLPFPLPGRRPGRANQPSLRTQLGHPALRLRDSRARATFRLQSELLTVLRDRLTDDGFVEVFTPRFLSDPAEGGAELLRAAYFDREVFLGQSTQLYRQMLLPELRRVFELTSVFHGDRHATRWHLNEFTALEAELDGVDGLDSVVAQAERLVSDVCEHLMGAGAELVGQLGATPPVLTLPVPRWHYRDALAYLSEQHNLDVSDRFNLTPTGNRLLSDRVRRECGSDVLVLEGSPVRHAQFYDMVDPDDSAFARTFIVLCRGISFVCGGQRLHRVEDYHRSLAASGTRREPLRAYLDVMAGGMQPHGGFSIAIARLLTAVLQLGNIREAVMFPRDASIVAP
jgi:nondiscriminating aspartyl-tRNA synthetase